LVLRSVYTSVYGVINLNGEILIRWNSHSLNEHHLLKPKHLRLGFFLDCTEKLEYSNKIQSTEPKIQQPILKKGRFCHKHYSNGDKSKKVRFNPFSTSQKNSSLQLVNEEYHMHVASINTTTSSETKDTYLKSSLITSLNYHHRVTVFH